MALIESGLPPDPQVRGGDRSRLSRLRRRWLALWERKGQRPWLACFPVFVAPMRRQHRLLVLRWLLYLCNGQVLEPLWFGRPPATLAVRASSVDEAAVRG